jgi:S1-C subfamily serine protease
MTKGVCFLFCCWTGAALAQASPSCEAFERVTVKIEAQNREGQEIGAGIVMQSDGKTAWIATAGHVIKDAQEVRIIFFGSKDAFASRLVRLKPGSGSLDLAVLEVISSRGNLPRFAAGSLRTDALAVGERVSFVGHPEDLDWQCYFNTDAISRLEYSGDDRLFLFSNPRKKPGASGGPVFDQFGNVIGIVLGEHASGDAIAIRIGEVSRILREDLRVTLGTGVVSQNTLDSAPLSPEFKQLETQLGELAGRANSLNDRLSAAERATGGVGGLPAQLQRAWQGMNEELNIAESALAKRNIPACEAAIGRSREHIATIEGALVK